MESLKKVFQGTDQEIVNAIQAHLYHEGFDRIESYEGIKIIPNDRGALPFDTVFHDAMNKLLYGQHIDENRIPKIKAMVENLHNTIIDLDEGVTLHSNSHSKPNTPIH